MKQLSFQIFRLVVVISVVKRLLRNGLPKALAATADSFFSFLLCFDDIRRYTLASKERFEFFENAERETLVRFS